MTFLQPSFSLPPIVGHPRFLHRSLALAVCLWLGACADPEPPVACGTIPDQSVTVGMKASVEPCFEDPEMDEITLSAVSSDPGVATVTVQTESVHVEGVSPGSATVTVTATDPDMLTADVSFGVVVPNQPPGIRGRMSPASMLVDGSFRWILSHYFDEPDGQELTYSAESSDPEVVLATVSTDTLTATGIAIGVEKITVTAADPSGLTATLAVEVTVLEPVRLLRDDFNTDASLANWGFHADIVEPAVADGMLRVRSLTPSFVGLVTSQSVLATGWEATTLVGNASDGGWASLVVSTDDTTRFSLYLIQFGADGGFFGLGQTDFRFLVLDRERNVWVINDGWHGTSDAVPETGEVAEASMSMKSGTLRVAVGDTELLSIDLQEIGLPVNMIAVSLGVWPREEGAIAFFDWIEVTGLSRAGRIARRGPAEFDLVKPMPITRLSHWREGK